MACLLHDVGHTPFSHTFEEFFSRKAMTDALKKILNDENFTSNVDACNNNLTEHELLSAYVAVSKFKDVFNDDPEIDWSLLSMMIIGVKYLDENDQPTKNSFENVMVDLIHGSIDADGLDYVCRDAWAGGYHNFSVDLNRLIESIEITNNDGYQLAFKSKVLNEIEAVLNIKNFQFLYVMNHHKVLLEQHYLKEAVKEAAVFHTGVRGNDDAIKELCNFKAFVEPIILHSSKYRLFRPNDDDFVALMKQTENGEYIEGWFSRSFSHSPIWKSKIEFFAKFSEELYGISVPVIKQQENKADTYLKETRAKLIEAICEKECKKYVMDSLHLEDNDIIQIRIEPKIRRINPDEIFISLNDILTKFTELIHDSFSVISEQQLFCYWYVNLNKVDGKNDNEKKEAVISFIQAYLYEYSKNL